MIKKPNPVELVAPPPPVMPPVEIPEIEAPTKKGAGGIDVSIAHAAQLLYQTNNNAGKGGQQKGNSLAMKEGWGGGNAK